MPRVLVILLLACSFLAFACGGGSEGGGGGEATEQTEEEVRQTILGFLEAFLGGETLKLQTYLVGDCENVMNASLMAKAEAGIGEGEITVEVPEVVVDVVDEDHIVVTDLPGAQALVDGRPLPKPEESPGYEMVKQDGVWRIENCEDF